MLCVIRSVLAVLAVETGPLRAWAPGGAPHDYSMLGRINLYGLVTPMAPNPIACGRCQYDGFGMDCAFGAQLMTRAIRTGHNPYRTHGRFRL